MLAIQQRLERRALEQHNATVALQQRLHRNNCAMLPAAAPCVATAVESQQAFGMLPGAIMGNYDQNDIQVDLVKLANYANSRIIFDLATDINLEKKNLSLEKRNPLSFDILSIDIGINYSLPQLKGFKKFVLPIKPFRDFFSSWERKLR